MELTLEHIQGLRAKIAAQREEALTTVRQCEGAFAALNAVINILSQPEQEEPPKEEAPPA